MEFKVLDYASYQNQETAAGIFKDLKIECFISSTHTTILIADNDYEYLLSCCDSNIDIDYILNADIADLKDNELAYLVLELANN